MKVLSKFMIAFFALTLVVACKNQPEGEKAKVGEASTEVAKSTAAAKSFSVTSGTVYWTGTKVGGQHSGTINVGKGQIAVENGNITSGNFAIDMTSLANTDLPAEKQGDLVGHLSNDDFFDVPNHPRGNFEIVSVAPATGTEGVTHNITGNLTLKGITKSIVIPANVVLSANSFNASTPKFTINRTDWDIKYGSGLIGTAKDKIIHDEVSLNIELAAQVQ